MQSTRSAIAKPRAPLLGGDPSNIHEDPGRRTKASNFEDPETETNVVEQPDYGDSSDDSDDSIGSVQESVAEDMLKLEATFKGISKRFRLINRIGEGIVDSLLERACLAGRIKLTVHFSS